MKKKLNIGGAEEKVSDFYNTIGWEKKSGVTEDARQWEDMRNCSKEYVYVRDIRKLTEQICALVSCIHMIHFIM